jgi:hypothetical protein
MSILILPRRFRETHIDLLNEAGIGFGIGVSGKYLVEVCRDGKVIRQPFGPKMRPNLITNGFFDYCMGTNNTTVLRQAVLVARVGTGTTPPANGDTQLAAQTQTTSGLFTGGGNTFSNDTVNGAWTGTWVYEFAAVGSGVTLNEAGLAVNAGPSGGLSTHALFPSGVVLNAGDNLRLTYSITYSIPSIVTPITVSLAAVNGFNVSGSMKTCGLFNTNSGIFGTITATDAVTTTGSGLSQGQTCFGTAGTAALLSAPTSFPTVNTNPTATGLGTSIQGSQASYTNGSFTRNQTWTWVPSNPSSTVSNVNAIQFYDAVGGVGLYLILTSAQTKANTNTLAITMSCTMARA